MKRKLLFRGLLIAASVVASALLAYPLNKKINLGLDLRGGMHLVLQVHTEDALRSETEADMARLLARAQEEKIAGVKAQRTSESSFAVSGAPSEARDRLRSFLARDRWSSSVQGADVTFAMTPAAINDVRTGAVNQAKQTIDNRINAFGVAESVTQVASGNRIVVQLPGVDDFDRVRKLINNTAFLEFRIVKFPRGGGGVPNRETILQNFGGKLPDDMEILDGDAKDKQGTVTGTMYYGVEKKRSVTGRDLKTSRPSRGQFGDPIVDFTFTPDGAKAFADLTGANIGNGLAIVLDGRVVSAPVVKSQIRDNGMIEGNFTQQEAEDLSMVLRSGALPAKLSYLYESQVGPSLGRDSIRDGVLAGIVGTGLVVLSMLLYYKLSGVNAVAALLLNVLILFAGLSMFHATLTLPGIAGVILTIGMAVDANVLVFERIREELRAGRTVRSAIDLGFDRAFTSIIDTHVTTLVSAVFLFQFGTGPIKGFAVTLTIGLLASLYTAVFVSRWIFDFVLSRRRVQTLSI
jgi:preprotein translocase subunit SecD